MTSASLRRRNYGEGKKCLERNVFASKRSTGLSEQCVGVIPQNNWTCWETDTCVAPLFFPWSQKLPCKQRFPHAFLWHRPLSSNEHPETIYHLYKNKQQKHPCKSCCNMIIHFLQNAGESTELSGTSDRSSFGQGQLLTWWPVISPAPALGHKEIKLERATGNARPFPVTEKNDVVKL